MILASKYRLYLMQYGTVFKLENKNPFGIRKNLLQNTSNYFQLIGKINLIAT